MTYNPDRDTFAAPDRRPSRQQQWREVSARIDAEDAARRAAAAEPAALLPTAVDAAGRALRHDGWTPDRQRAFLAAIAEGETVERACRLVQMAPSTAYALRQRAAGAGFALGWKAANLLRRERIADALLTRAIDGQVETTTRPDGTVVSRHRYDNRTGLALLTRLDRMADEAPADPAAAAAGHAARLVAQDFEAFLDTIEQDRGPAAAGLFLAHRTGLAAGSTAGVADLDPVLALARADRFVRTGVACAAEVDTADLDPRDRAGWTAEQWRRADAAGLLLVAPAPPPPPAPETAPASPLSPLVEPDAVAWDDDVEEYRTHLPPPADETPEWESHAYGHPDYARCLTAREQALVDRLDAIDAAERHAAACLERDAWFAQVEADIAAAERGEGEGDPSNSRFPGAGRGPDAVSYAGEGAAPLLEPLVAADAEVNSA